MKRILYMASLILLHYYQNNKNTNNYYKSKELVIKNIEIYQIEQPTQFPKYRTKILCDDDKHYYLIGLLPDYIKKGTTVTMKYIVVIINKETRKYVHKFYDIQNENDEVTCFSLNILQNKSYTSHYI
jgi:hypothetical protein